jgi:hypothetical protein
MSCTNGLTKPSILCTSNRTIDEASIEPVDFTLSPSGDNYGDVYQVSNYFLNNENYFVGKVVYLSANDPVPSLDEQQGIIYLLDDSTDSQNKLDNLTYADAAIIIASEGRGVQNVTTNNANITVMDVNYSEGTTIKSILETYNLTIVDNFENEGQTLTFLYNIFNGPLWPDSKWVLFDRIPDHYWLMDHDEGFLGWVTHNPYLGNTDTPNMGCFLLCVEFWSELIFWANLGHLLTPCQGVVLADHGEYHYMLSIPRIAFNIFTVNESIGDFLYDNHDSATLTGYTNQEFLPEGPLHHIGGIGYNVYGNLTISKSPENANVIVSNRYDGMWGQTPGDSGVGTAICLGMAKFFKENDIPRKYNMTFLFTTGEEYGFLGAKYFRDLHPDFNIKDWFIFEQSGFNQEDCALCAHVCGLNDDTNAVITRAIFNDTQYWSRTGYKNITDTVENPGSEQGQITTSSRSTFCIVKDQDNRWDTWHRTGNNFQNGDCIANTDRNDVNLTTEMDWNLLKYFCVNPNCWFDNISFTAFDSPNDGDTLNDSIRTNFTIHSVLPSDKVRVELNLSYEVDGIGVWVPNAGYTDYLLTSRSQNESYIFTIPDSVTDGYYNLSFNLYNSTGRINKIVYGSSGTYYNDTTDASGWVHLYHPLGYPDVGHSIQSVSDKICGSIFTANENGRADNITAFINKDLMSPGPYTCMLYRASDEALIGTTTSDWVPLPRDGNFSSSSGWAVFNFTGTKPMLEQGTQYVITCWGDSEYSRVYYNESGTNGTGRYDDHTYGTSPPNPADFTNNSRYYSIYCSYTPDITPPEITDVTASPHTVGFGYNVTITANVTDNGSDVNLVKVRIAEPGGQQTNNTMTHISGNLYQYIFTHTWDVDQYNYSIWTQDNETNSNTSDTYHFHVSAEATISIATLKNSYSSTQYINITDPPNPPENLTVVSRGLTWNTYYNASSGNNILETYIGPVNYQQDNNTWMPINNTFYQLAANHPAYVYGYRSGNNHGLYGVYFKSNAQNEWPVAFTYNRSDDPTVHVIRSKLVGVGYVDPQSKWAYQYLQNVQSSQGQTNDNSITFEDVFTGTDVTWSYGNIGLKEEITMSNATKTVLQNHPPSQYGLNDASSYLVFITKLDYQNLNLYNNSGLLDGNVTISDNGVDFKDFLGQFKCALPLGEAYELNNESARQKLTYRIIHLNGNTYLLSGLKLSDLNAMIFPVVIDPTLTVYSTSSDGYIYKSGSVYSTVQSASSGTVDSSGTYITIGQRYISLTPGIYYIYRGFVFFNTSALPSNAYLDNATLSLYKKDDYSTTDFDITIQNGQPTYPHNPMQTGDYNKNYYSGNGGSLNTSRFTSGYNAIPLSNLNWINKTGVTKLCLRSSRDINAKTPTGAEYVNVHSSEFLGMCPPKLVINYRNQSKIKNTGSTTIKGYLLIQVQFYETSKGVAPRWVVDNDTVNETFTRTINTGQQLSLDAIFNGLIRASNLQHGTGTYRVYTAFRDPDCNILRTNDNVELVAWWQFSKT